MTRYFNRALLVSGVLVCASTGAGAATLVSTVTSNSHQYSLWRTTSAITFAQAEADAVAIGGHLVSIADEAENDLVYSLIGTNGPIVFRTAFNAWFGPMIGGYRTGPTSFAWSDGTAFDYTNWIPGQPDNAGGGENYIQLVAAGTPAPDGVDGRGKQWNDGGLPGTEAYAYITEVVTTAVPEPATWAMMIAGFGLVGGAMRRRGRLAIA